MQIKKTTTKKLIRSPKWILVNSQRNPINSAGWGEGGGGRVTYPGLASHGGGGVAVLLVTSCYRNLDKFWLDGPLGFLPFFPQRTFTL